MRWTGSDPGLYGFGIAIAFAVLGIVGLPIYRLFIVGTLVFGAIAACLLFFIRKTRKNPPGLFPRP
jgi:hypothetical protein